MNNNLFTKELKRNRKNLTIWTSIVMGLTVLVLSLFPYIKKMGDDMVSLIGNMPEGMSKAMGLNPATFNNVLGLYNTYYGIYIIVIMAIFTTSTGATIVSKEERDRTAEFLLTKPLSRKNIFWTKMGSLFILMMVIHLMQTLTAIIGILIFGDSEVDWNIFATMHLHGWVLIFFFTCLGVLIPSYVGSKKNFMGIAVGLVFGAFFLNAISKAAEGLGGIGYLSPFHYLGLNIFDEGYTVHWLGVVVFVLVGILLLWLGLRKWERADIGA